MIWRGMAWAILICAALFGGTVWVAGIKVAAAIWAVAVIITVGLFLRARAGSDDECG